MNKSLLIVTLFTTLPWFLPVSFSIFVLSIAADLLMLGFLVGNILYVNHRMITLAEYSMTGIIVSMVFTRKGSSINVYLIVLFLLFLGMYKGLVNKEIHNAEI